MATKVRPPPPPKPKPSGGGAATKAAASTPLQPHTATDDGHSNRSNGNHQTQPPPQPSPPQASTPSATAASAAPSPSPSPARPLESVVMTPRGKSATATVLLIERQLVERIGERQHVAGGQHAGIIINKDERPPEAATAAHLSLEFRVFLVSAQTALHTQESRTLRFWFREWLVAEEAAAATGAGRQAQVAQDFFRELVAPKEFPRGECE